MLTLVLADVGLGPIAREPTTPLLLSLGLFIAIVVSEGIVLWAFRRKSWVRSLLHSAIMNIVSTMAGLVLSVVYLLMPLEGLEVLPEAARVVMFVGVTWGLSVLIEGLVLRGLKWENERRTWLAVAVANAVSYVLIVLLVVGSLR